MTQILNTNVASLLVQRNLSQSQEAINISMDRLSSGLRINGALMIPLVLQFQTHLLRR